jgi:hypothetical protein
MSEDKLIPPAEDYTDHLHTLARAGISFVPMVGGAAGELFNMIIAPPILKRRNEWMNEVAERLRSLADQKRISLEQLKDQPAFIDAVLQTTQAAIRCHEQTKREALRNAVLNAALPGSPDSSTQLMFISFVDRFTEWHIRVLDLFADPPRWAADHNTSFPQLLAGGLTDILLHAFRELRGRDDFYRQIWSDLNNSGLLNTPSLGGTMTGQGLLAKRVTNFGEQFIRFISEPPQ